LLVGNKGGPDVDTTDKDASGISATDTEATGTDVTGTDTPGTDTQNTDATGAEAAGANNSNADMFSYSEGIDENGFWENITALDYVGLFNYQSFSIPREIHEITDKDVQSEIRNLAANYYPETTQVTNRAVIDGDTVNIDYVGSIDGVEFEGGSTGGGGAEVTAGSTNYIDDFLTQIIGHTPGETINVEVTFPDVYENNPDLAGKDALFVTTINYIVEYIITDDFVAENLYDQYGWMSVIDMEEDIREGLQRSAVENYIGDYMVNEVAYHETPDNILTYQEKRVEYEERNMLESYQEYADMYEMDFNTFLQYYVGVSGEAELIERNRSSIVSDITCSLAIQAIAEDAGISAGDDDLAYYLPEYTSYEDQYGMPWLKQYVLGKMVLDYIIANAIFG